MDGFENMGRVRKTFGGGTGTPSTVVPVEQAGTAGQTGATEVLAATEAGEVQDGAPVSTSAPAPTPLKGATLDTLDATSEGPGFKTVPLEGEDVTDFMREYRPSLQIRRCVADRDMLLKYMADTEHRYHLTLSFPAYGVDPIVFDEAAAARAKTYQDSGDEIPLGSDIVEIAMPGTGDGESKVVNLYEKIEVDGVLYLSSVTECLDADYLHNVIREATEEIYMHGQYMYTMVGPRPLVENKQVDHANGNPLIETLKLNSYELNMLVGYVSGIAGVNVTYGTFDNRQAILFKRARK